MTLGDDLIFGSDVPARETSPTGSPGRNGTPKDIEVEPTPGMPPFNPSVEPAENADPKGPARKRNKHSPPAIGWFSR